MTSTGTSLFRVLPPLLGALGIAFLLSSCTAPANAGGGAAATLDSAAKTAQLAKPMPGQDENIRIVSALPAPLDTDNGTSQPVAENDILEVRVFQVKDLDSVVQVDSNGHIFLPLIGAVTASGKSVHALEREIAEKYGAQYLQSPQVTVFVKQSYGQRVTIDGGIANPGIYPITAKSTLTHVIAEGGGLREVADPTKVYIFRDIGNERMVANYDVSAIRDGKSPDPRLYGGDVVVVFDSSTKVAARNLREALGLARLAIFP